MGSLRFLFSTAVKNLRRGGQRVFVAILCIAFGVMSLVAMTLLSQALEQMLVIKPALLVGADISMVREAEDYILPEHEQQLKDLQQEGVIERYTLAAYTSTLSYRLAGSGELHFPAAAIGIDPANYPLVGSFSVAQPGSIGLETLLQEPGDILVTKDIALEYELKEGDHLILSDISSGTPLDATIRAIVTDTPNHQGDKIYYNLATAELLANSSRMLNTALVTAPDPEAAKEIFAASGWHAFLSTQLALGDAQVQEIFEMALKGAAILGLLVGGIGIANTMQVLLRRRRREVAIWKTLGYRESQIQRMFTIEAGLLGAIGSLIGAGLGVLLSYLLVDLFSRTSTLLIAWSFSPKPVFSGILVGILTTVLFSLVAIVASSRVQPVALLRNEPVPATRLGWLQNFGMVLLVAIPFTVMTSLIMESALKGIAVLMGALFGLIFLGGLMAALLWVTVRILPLRAVPLANMARNNLRRRGMGLVFAMIALFVGVVSLGLGGMVTQNAQRILEVQASEMQGDNLAIIAPAEQEAAVQNALEEQKLEAVHPGYLTSIKSAVMSDDSDFDLPSVLIGRDTADQMMLTGAEWGSQPNGVYVFSFMAEETGDSVDITLWDGSQHTLPVVGTYQYAENSIAINTELGLLMSNELSLRLSQPDTIQYYARVPASRLVSASSELGKALPKATVIDLIAYSARFTQVYKNLFVFAAAMAGLALLAGVLLIANSVSIAMIDRRYEIGVLKAIGYRRGHVLLTLMVEYSLVAVIASAAGLGLINGFMAIIRALNPIAAFLFVMPFFSSAIIFAICVGLTLLTVLLVTLEPTRVSPVVVLNDRE